MVTVHDQGILSPAPSFSGSSARDRNSARISVLYVDENSMLLDIVCRRLEICGDMMVDTSLTPEDAIQKMRYIAYDVIVTDYNIGSGMGNEFLRFVRSAGSMVPFVYFVLFRSDDLEEEAQRLGNVRIVEKMDVCCNSPFPALHEAVVRSVAGRGDAP